MISKPILSVILILSITITVNTFGNISNVSAQGDAASQSQRAFIDTDKSSYVIGETVNIGGKIDNPEFGKLVRLDIYDAENKVFEKEIFLDTDNAGYFSTDITLFDFSVNNVGEYNVVATYENTTQTKNFTVVDAPQKLILSPNPAFLLSTEKSSYTVGNDSNVIISGKVNDYQFGTPVRLDVYDANNNIFDQNILIEPSVDADKKGEFSFELPLHDFSVENIGKYKIIGTYDKTNNAFASFELKG